MISKKIKMNKPKIGLWIPPRESMNMPIAVDTLCNTPILLCRFNSRCEPFLALWLLVSQYTCSIY